MLFLLQRPQLCVAVPVAASGAAPAHLLLNVLPFMEDFRDYKFPSFTKKAWCAYFVGCRGELHDGTMGVDSSLRPCCMFGCRR